MSSVDMNSDNSKQKKRTSRACDHCRKIRNRCIRTPNFDSCDYCLQSGIVCTFNGPNFKRGPPKGYIQALERRLQMVESVLDAIIVSEEPKTNVIINRLGKDPIARHVLELVHYGPFGLLVTSNSNGNEHGSNLPLASPTSHSPSNRLNGRSGRSNRESRIERELMSQNSDDVEIPSDWKLSLLHCLEEQNNDIQANLYRLSAVENNWSAGPPNTAYAMDESEDEDYARSSPSADRTRASSAAHQTCHHIDSSEIGFLKDMLKNIMPDAPFAAFAHACTLQTNSLTDGMTSPSITWPQISSRQRLLDLYVTHVHPFFPMLRDFRFILGIESVRNVAAEFLTLAIFATASLYDEAGGKNVSSSASCPATRKNSFYDDAGRLLALSIGNPCLQTCQGLALLAYYDIALDLSDRAWIHIGIAIRMAITLGLSQNSEDIEGEKGEENLTWWSLIILERFIACSLGRSLESQDIKGDKALPSQFQRGGVFDHMICQGTCEAHSYPHILICFGQLASLSIIVGDILEVLYASHGPQSSGRERSRVSLLSRLHTWLENLPDDLQLRSQHDGASPIGSYVLMLHLWFWNAVILVNRECALPREIPLDQDAQRTVAEGCEQLQGAADQILRISVMFRDLYGHTASPPLLPSFLFNAGAVLLLNSMSIRMFANASLNSRHREDLVVDKALGQLGELEGILPCASRKRQLLVEAKSLVEKRSPPLVKKKSLNRIGRPLSINIPPRWSDLPAVKQDAGRGDTTMASPAARTNNGSNLMAQMLGLEVPGLSVPSEYSLNISAGIEKLRNLRGGATQLDAARPESARNGCTIPGTRLPASDIAPRSVVVEHGISTSDMYALTYLTEQLQPVSAASTVDGHCILSTSLPPFELEGR